MEIDQSAVTAAARLLKAGELVAFPTETVYGLGADAENPAAVAKIYAAKGRPSDHPVIVHLAPGADLTHWAKKIPAEAHKLIARFWPGPLTLILKRADGIPAAVSGGQDTIGLRCPAHPVAQALLQSFKEGKGGIAAPSANRFGHISPTLAAHVREEFANGPLVQCILEGGQSEVGIESTILDLSRMNTLGPVLLRPGQVSAANIENLIGVSPRMPDVRAPRASGTLDAHYAPSTPLALVHAGELRQILERLKNAGHRVALMHHLQSASRHDATAEVKLPDNPAGYARGLYAGLRELDAAGAAIIIVVRPPYESAWDAINDRLRRAAHDFKHALAALPGMDGVATG